MAGDIADPASAPQCLLMSAEVDAVLEREMIAAGPDDEHIGGIRIVDGKLVVSTDSRAPGTMISIWHTHPNGTPFSSFDVGGLFSYGYPWDVVRTSKSDTYVAALTTRSPRDRTLESIKAEIDALQEQWWGAGRLMSFEESQHWAIYAVTRKYDAVYYYAAPGSLELRLVTEAGPVPVPDPKGFPG
ncbi:MAG: hypothetical protein AAGD35_09370 [Actinomycetota bacterium]